jgi:hypothetical protein
MKVEILTPFYGRPDDDVASDAQLFTKGAVIDVPEEFGAMIVGKELAKAASGKPAVKKETANEA